MLKDLFKYKVAFKVPVAMLIFSIVGVYFGYIKIDLWLNSNELGGGYQFQISFKYLIDLITQQLNNILNQIKGAF